MKTLFMLNWSMGGPEVIIIFLLISMFILPLALVEILTSKFQDSNDKVIWLLIVLFLGPIGAIFYAIMGRKKRVSLEKHKSIVKEAVNDNIEKTDNEYL